MKKNFLVIAISCLLAFHVSAQTRNRYVFDNFDTSRGVEVALPPPVVAAAPKNSPKDKKLVKKTVQQRPTMNMQDAVSLKNNPNLIGQSLNKLSMSAGSTMGGFTTGDDAVD
jgi:hypothetical protein